MLNVRVTDSLKITSDEYNFILTKRVTSTTGKKDSWVDFEWYPSLDMAISRAIDMFLGPRSPVEARSVSGLIKELKQARELYTALQRDILNTKL